MNFLSALDGKFQREDGNLGREDQFYASALKAPKRNKELPTQRLI